jgi:polyhydroxyalkanoate synthase
MAASAEKPGDLLEWIRKEVERAVLRQRNGLMYMAGLYTPHVGLSPKSTVWSRGKVELWRYDGDEVRYRPPLLLVPSVISRSYVLDLRPSKSFVSALLDRGFDVFLVDWGVPDSSDSGNTLATYVDDYLPEAAAEMLAAAGARELHVLGYCLGGNLAALFVAGHPELAFRSLIAMATPFDFREMTVMTTVLHAGRLDPDALIDETGNVPPDLIYESFQMLRPTDRIVQYVNLLDNLWNDKFLEDYTAMSHWTRDQVPLPGALLHDVVRELIRSNGLLDGSTHVGGRRVDLAAVRCPVLNILAERDHIVPPASAAPLVDIVGSDDATELRLTGGHVSFVIGHQASQETWPAIASWLAERSDAA